MICFANVYTCFFYGFPFIIIFVDAFVVVVVCFLLFLVCLWVSSLWRSYSIYRFSLTSHDENIEKKETRKISRKKKIWQQQIKILKYLNWNYLYMRVCCALFRLSFLYRLQEFDFLSTVVRWFCFHAGRTRFFVKHFFFTNFFHWISTTVRECLKKCCMEIEFLLRFHQST